MVRASFKSWLGNWQEWGIILLLFLALAIPVGSIEQARWITPHPSLILVLALALLTSWVLGKSRLKGLIVHPLTVTLGVAVTIWQGSNLFPSPEIAVRVSQLMVALQSWWQAISSAQPAEGTAHFAVLLIFFTWMMGYISTQFILQRRNAWIAVCLGAIALLANLSNLPEQRFTSFYAYALVALFLVGMTSLSKHRDWFKERGIAYPNPSTAHFAASLLCLSTLAILAAWLTPEVRVQQFESFVGTKTLWSKDIEKYFDNFFASVPAKQFFLKSDAKSTLRFGDSSFNRGDLLEFAVISKEPLYLRTRMYDSYISSGWTGSNATEHMHRQGVPSSSNGDVSKRSQITYSVVPKMKTDILLTGGEFVSSNIPVSVKTLAPPSFDPARSTLSDDTVSITSLHPLKPERRYTVTTSISSATPEDLSRTDGEYPPWVTDYYLQLPPTFPARVRQLTERITGGARTPYDKALAVKQYLSQINYSLDVKAPPRGADGVDYFLFTEKSGNCVQFASAMAVMLRSLDIPTRVLSGYAPGEWDTTTESYLLTSKERHAWPEVYFSGYGWVGFDPTPEATNGPEPLLTGSGALTAPPAWLGWETEEEFAQWLDWLRYLNGLEPQERQKYLAEMGWGAEEWREWQEWLKLQEQVERSIAEQEIEGSSSSTALQNITTLFMPIAISGITLAFILAIVFTYRRQLMPVQDDPSEIYRRMCFLASLARISPKPQQTPLEYYARLASAFPQQAEALDTITQRYVEVRYSPRKELGRWERWRLQQSWRVVRQRLIKRLLRIKN